jgi:hypothetical protein
MKMYKDIFDKRYVFKQKLVLLKAGEFEVQTHSFLFDMYLLTIAVIGVWSDLRSLMIR